MTDEDYDELTLRSMVVQGLPMSEAAVFLAALVIRLGGDVTLTRTELQAAQGLMFSKTEKGGIRLEANTGASPTILDAPVIE